jgi:hypothetical protein
VIQLRPWRRKASDPAESLPPPPAGQSPTLAAWPKDRRPRLWVGKDWLCTSMAWGKRWVRTDQLALLKWVIDGHISMRDKQDRKLIVRPADLRQNPEVLSIVVAAIQRSMEHGLVLGELLRKELGLEEQERG